MPDKPQRRLAAIFVLDVSGFSRMMAEDEAGTLNQVLAQQQNLIAPAVRAHQGRIVKLMGDGVLAVFPSVISAVEAAAQIQAGAARGRHLKLRIGINLGEVIIAQGDVYGDDVNIAARLEALAPVGGVALSAAAYGQVRNRIPYKFEDLGLHEVKNLPEPVQAYALGEELTSLPSLSQAAAQARIQRTAQAKPSQTRSWRPVLTAAAACAVLAAAGGGWWLAGLPGLPRSQQDRPPPSAETAQLPPLIAVLPFTAAAGPPELAQALSGEVIRSLSAAPGLAVVAPDSSLAAAGLPPERAAQLLGAQYLVSGHLPGDPLQGIRLRIHGASGQAGLPARRQAGLPELVSAAAADILSYFGQPVPAAPAVRVPDQAMMQLLVARSKLAEGRNGAAGLALQQALLLDPSLAEAQVLQAGLELDFLTGPLASLPQRAARAAERLEGAPETAGTLRVRAVAAQFDGRPAAALDLAGKLAQAYPNDADGHLLRAWLLHLAGEGPAAEAAYATALRLNPVPPPLYHNLRAAMLFSAGQEDAAMASALQALEQEPQAQLAQAVHCAGLAGAGRFKEAGGTCAGLQAAGLTLDEAAGAFAFSAEGARQRLRSSLSLAGLPGRP